MNEKTINAMPTKELFIDMLTRDIPLIPAIIDLVDNCADGARRIKGNSSYKGLWARVELSPKEFRVSDNCGGITVETARKYAFRFGRASGMPSVKHSIGEFGVGMKRAIFKIGKKFKVKSITEDSRFVVDEDVAKWAQKEEWQYEFSSLEEDIKSKKDEIGTTITVTDLHEDVSGSFGLENFKTELANELKARLQDPIAKGLAITLDGIPVDAEPLELLSHEQLAPARKLLEYGDALSNRVKVKLYCGLGKERDPSMAGWHVFCNGRLILEADKTAVTGWGDKSDGIRIPGFHYQYNHLRGYAYFDSDDPGRLPWNTTKTGLNTDSVILRATRIEMKKLMRPVVDFLNKLKEEKAERGAEDAGESGEEEDNGPLAQIIERSESTDVDKVKTRDIFQSPVLPAQLTKTTPSMQRIQYDVPSDKVKQVQKALKVRSFKDVGLRTFNYYYDAEIDE